LGPTSDKERSVISKKKGDSKVIEDRERGIESVIVGATSKVKVKGGTLDGLRENVD